jgi:hypothetical protein
MHLRPGHLRPFPLQLEILRDLLNHQEFLRHFRVRRDEQLWSLREGDLFVFRPVDGG